MLKAICSLFFALSVFASNLQAAVSVGPKHLYIFYPSQDKLVGSYLFVVNNDGNQPENYTFPVMIPKEITDFQAQDALSPNELKLGPDGGLQIEKLFQPGETMLQITFVLPASEGVALAKFTPPFSYESFSVFVWQDALDVRGPAGMDIQKGVNLSGRMFDTYSIGAGEVGKPVEITFERVPEGRKRLWVIGGIFGTILLLAGFSIAFYTRPKLNLNEELA